MALSQSKLAQKRNKKKLARKGKKYNPQQHFAKQQTIVAEPQPLIVDTELLDLS